MEFCNMKADTKPIYKALFLKVMTYRMINDAREEIVVKSGKCVSPVLDMLL